MPLMRTAGPLALVLALAACNDAPTAPAAESSAAGEAPAAVAVILESLAPFGDG